MSGAALENSAPEASAVKSRGGRPGAKPQPSAGAAQGYQFSDVVSGRFSKRTQIKMDIVGICVFLFPFVYMIIKLSMPLVINAYQIQEMSSNAGGLIRWPVFALLPLGMLLLGIQGLSELIKRVVFLQGLIPDPTKKQGAKSPEEELAEFLLHKEVAAREAALTGATK